MWPCCKIEDIDDVVLDVSWWILSCESCVCMGVERWRCPNCELSEVTSSHQKKKCHLLPFCDNFWNEEDCDIYRVKCGMVSTLYCFNQWTYRRLSIYSTLVLFKLHAAFPCIVHVGNTCSIGYIQIMSCLTSNDRSVLSRWNFCRES